MAWLDKETRRILQHLIGNYAIVAVILVASVALDLFERACVHWGVSPFICAGMTLLARFLFILDVTAASGLSVVSMYQLFKSKL